MAPPAGIEPAIYRSKRYVMSGSLWGRKWRFHSESNRECKFRRLACNSLTESVFFLALHPGVKPGKLGLEDPAVDSLREAYGDPNEGRTHS